MIDDEPTVFLFQLGPSGKVVREAARQMHLEFEVCLDRKSLFACCKPTRPGCLLIDLVTDLDDLSIIGQLRKRRIRIPVIVLSNDSSVRRVVEAMRAGAWDFRIQPSHREQIQQAINEAIAENQKCRRRESHRLRIEQRMATLTPGERQVLELLVKGKTNREVATAVNLSIRSIEVRRSKIKEKMQARSMVELVRMILSITSSDIK